MIPKLILKECRTLCDLVNKNMRIGITGIDGIGTNRFNAIRTEIYKMTGICLIDEESIRNELGSEDVNEFMEYVRKGQFRKGVEQVGEVTVQDIMGIFSLRYNNKANKYIKEVFGATSECELNDELRERQRVSDYQCKIIRKIAVEDSYIIHYS